MFWRKFWKSTWNHNKEILEARYRVCLIVYKSPFEILFQNLANFKTTCQQQPLEKTPNITLNIIKGHRSILSNLEFSVLCLLSEILILIGVLQLLASRFCLNKFCWLHPTTNKFAAWVVLPCKPLLKKGFVSSCLWNL